MAMAADTKANNTRREDDVTESIGTKNPLMMNLVVSSVLKNLDLENLRNCRLVNKIWNFESTPILKTKSKVVFGPDALNWKMVSKYLEEMIHFGHKNFYFSTLIEVTEIFNVENELKNFFCCLGNQIKSIHLAVNVEHCSHLESFKEIMENIPNVEELEIDLKVFTEYGQEFNQTTFLNNIKPLDKLQKLNLHSYFCPNSTIVTLQEMAEFFVKLVPKPESLVLEESCISKFRLANEILKKYANSRVSQEVTIFDISLDVVNKDPEVIFPVLSEWPVSLKKLELHILEELEGFDSKSFQALLNRHCSTLEDLSFNLSFDLHYIISVHIQMPKFPKLRKLNIRMNENSYEKIDFQFNSDLMDHFPMLEMEQDKIVEMFAKLR